MDANNSVIFINSEIGDSCSDRKIQVIEDETRDNRRDSKQFRLQVNDLEELSHSKTQSTVKLLNLVKFKSTISKQKCETNSGLLSPNFGNAKKINKPPEVPPKPKQKPSNRIISSKNLLISLDSFLIGSQAKNDFI